MSKEFPPIPITEPLLPRLDRMGIHQSLAARYCKESATEIRRILTAMERLEACLACPLPDDAPSVSDAIQIIKETLHP